MKTGAGTTRSHSLNSACPTKSYSAFVRCSTAPGALLQSRSGCSLLFGEFELRAKHFFVRLSLRLIQQFGDSCDMVARGLGDLLPNVFHLLVKILGLEQVVLLFY